MSHRLASSALIAGLLCSASALAAPDVPALAGFSYKVTDRGPLDDATAFHPIPGNTGPGPIAQDPARPYKHGVQNRVADVNNPILKPWAKQLMSEEVKRLDAGGIPFVPTSRCWPGGVPGIALYPGNIQFWQNPNEVYIIQAWEAPRRIFLNQDHPKNVSYSWYGDSIGHYENGNTLVVDTVGLDDKGPIDRLGTPHSKQLHVVEHIKADGQWISTTIHVEDPVTFNMPFDELVEFKKGGRPAFDEYACAEGSTEYWIPEGQIVPPPTATRLDF